MTPGVGDLLDDVRIVVAVDDDDDADDDDGFVACEADVLVLVLFGIAA